MAGEEILYTPESANAVLSDVRERLLGLAATRARATDLQGQARVKVAPDGTSPQAREWLQITADLERQLAWFSRRSIIVRDVDRGLVDFPATREGRPVFLCWRLGEDSVEHWHEVDTGFAGRKPL